MAWTLSRTGATTITLPSSFNLQDYRSETSYARNPLNGEGAIVRDASIYSDAYELILTGLIKGTDAADADSQFQTIEDMATSHADDLTLTNTSISGQSYVILHNSTRAQRLGAAVLRVTISFLTNFTRI